MIGVLHTCSPNTRYSAGERESICSKVKNTPSETDKDVWNKTLEEVDRGWLLGPFDPKQIPTHYPLCKVKKLGVWMTSPVHM